MTKAWMLGIVVCVLGMGTAEAYDDLKNSKFEKRLNSIYRSSYATPVSDSEWSFFLDKVESDSYTVRTGDTLWNLSKVFFGDGAYWSKIWSLNERITNPHLIFPDVVIRFFSGTMAQPPNIQLVQPGIDPLPPGADEAAAAQGPPVPPPTPPPAAGPSHLYPGAPAIPPSQTRTTPVNNNIPPAFQVSSFQINNFDKSGVSLDVRPPDPVSPRLVPHTFFHQGSESSFDNFGKVIEIEDGEETAGFGGLVYIRSAKKLAKGEIITIIGKDYAFSKGRYRGTVFRYMGEVEVIEAINDQSYRAKVVAAILPIEVGAFLSDETIPNFSLEGGRPQAGKYDIIGGAYENEREVFGPNSILFIAAGSEQNVQVDDIFGVYKNRLVRFSDATYWQSPHPIAVIKVFRVETQVSSAMVLLANEEVRPGDSTGPLAATSLDIGEGQKEELDGDGPIDYEGGEGEESDLDTVEEGLDSEDELEGDEEEFDDSGENEGLDEDGSDGEGEVETESAEEESFDDLDGEAPADESGDELAGEEGLDDEAEDDLSDEDSDSDDGLDDEDDLEDSEADSDSLDDDLEEEEEF